MPSSTDTQSCPPTLLFRAMTDLGAARLGQNPRSTTRWRSSRYPLPLIFCSSPPILASQLVALLCTVRISWSIGSIGPSDACLPWYLDEHNCLVPKTPISRVVGLTELHASGLVAYMCDLVSGVFCLQVIVVKAATGRHGGFGTRPVILCSLLHGKT